MILQRYESVVMKNMMDLETKKEQEIKNMVILIADLAKLLKCTKEPTPGKSG